MAVSLDVVDMSIIWNADLAPDDGDATGENRTRREEESREGMYRTYTSSYRA